MSVIKKKKKEKARKKKNREEREREELLFSLYLPHLAFQRPLAARTEGWLKRSRIKRNFFPFSAVRTLDWDKTL